MNIRLTNVTTLLMGSVLPTSLGLPHERVYKTLVTTGKSGSHYVFVIPIEAELDLKKAARAVGEKSVEMLPVREITTVTGYVRGGCTAIGMKKAFPTTIQETAQTLDYIYVSGGKLGMQLKLSPDNLKERDTGTICGCYFLTFRSALGFFEIYDLQSCKYPV